MTKSDDRNLRLADLRLIAAHVREAERERKMLALAELLEERDHERERFRTGLQEDSLTGRA
jgi:hypothetical protein